MRVLGIDPGSRRTGWGVVDRIRGQNQLVAAGVIETDPSADMSARLASLHAGLRAVFAAHAPEAVAIEEIFAHRSAASALVLGQARGVALLVAGLEGHTPRAYNAMTIKRSVTGSGTATKAAVQRMVAVLVGQEVPGPHDAADAVALALTHHAHLPAARAANAAVAAPRRDAVAEALARRTRTNTTARGALPANARLGSRKGWR